MRLVIALIGVALVVGLAIYLAPDEASLNLEEEGVKDRVGSSRAWHYFNVSQAPTVSLQSATVEWPFESEWISFDDNLRRGTLLRVEAPDPGTYTLRVEVAGLTWTHEFVAPETPLHLWHTDSQSEGDLFREVFVVEYAGVATPIQNITVASDSELQSVVWHSDDLVLSAGDRFYFDQETIDQPRTLVVSGPDWSVTMTYGGGAGTPL